MHCALRYILQPRVAARTSLPQIAQHHHVQPTPNCSTTPSSSPAEGARDLVSWQAGRQHSYVSFIVSFSLAGHKQSVCSIFMALILLLHAVPKGT